MKEQEVFSNPAEGYEVFCDMSYYDLWAARKIGIREFRQTAHFMTREQAVEWTHDPRDELLDPRFN